jgi:hypothetical protein
MKDFRLFFRRLMPAIGAMACSSIMLVVVSAGCAEKKTVEEKTPQEIEKSRQEHIKMKQRETGQAPAPQQN